MTKREDIGVDSVKEILLNLALSPGFFQRLYNARRSWFVVILLEDMFSTLLNRVELNT